MPPLRRGSEPQNPLLGFTDQERRTRKSPTTLLTQETPKPSLCHRRILILAHILLFLGHISLSVRRAFN